MDQVNRGTALRGVCILSSCARVNRTGIHKYKHCFIALLGIKYTTEYRKLNYWLELNYTAMHTGKNSKRQENIMILCRIDQYGQWKMSKKEWWKDRAHINPVGRPMEQICRRLEMLFMIISKTQKISSTSKMLPHFLWSTLLFHNGPEEISSKGDFNVRVRDKMQSVLRGKKCILEVSQSLIWGFSSESQTNHDHFHGHWHFGAKGFLAQLFSELHKERILS